VFGRAQSDPADRHGDGRTALRCHGDAGLRPVSPGLDARIDREDESGAKHRKPGVQDTALLGRALPQGERGNRSEEDRECSAPERTEARPRVVSRHAPDEIAGDRECGE